MAETYFAPRPEAGAVGVALSAPNRHEHGPLRPSFVRVLSVA